MDGTRLRALDGLRGVAILLVVLAHVFPGPLPSVGPLGVLLFFVLSGYLITSLLVEEVERTGRIDYRQFMVRRALRLLPAMVVVCALYLLVLAVGPDVGTTVRSGLVAVLVALTFTADLVGGVGYPLPAEMTSHWSLGVEEHFYLLWPLVVAAALRRGAHRLGGVVRGVLVVGLGVALLSPLVVVAEPPHPYFLPTTWVHALAAGALVAVSLRLPRAGGLVAGVVRLARRPWAVPAGVAVLVPLAVGSNVFAPQVLLFTPFLGLALAWLLLAVLQRPRTGAVHRVLTLAPLTGLGSVSYGLYLLNLPVILFAVRVLGEGTLTRVLAALLALGLAVLLRRTVEGPALRLKDRIGRPRDAGPDTPLVPSHPAGAVPAPVR